MRSPGAVEAAPRPLDTADKLRRASHARRRAYPIVGAGNGIDRDPAQRYYHAEAGGANVVQVDTLGRGGVFALWASAFIAACALVAIVAMCFWIDRLSARVYVLEYDVSNVCAELKTREIISSCH